MNPEGGAKPKLKKSITARAVLYFLFHPIFHQVDSGIKCVVLAFLDSLRGRFGATCEKLDGNKKPIAWGDGLFLILVAVWTGFEPATPAVTGQYSNQLNYHTILVFGSAKITENPYLQKNYDKIFSDSRSKDFPKTGATVFNRPISSPN